jgi:predicted ATP-grasp superfamily ATP-dependent carboligase
VIGGGSANGLGIARILGRRGIPVYCLTSNPHEVTCSSRYCVGALIVPDVESDPKLLRQALTRLASSVPEHSVLFPTSDTAVLTLAQIREDLGHYVTFIPNRDIVETMAIKTRFYPSLQRHGVPHPRTRSPQYTSIHDIIQQLAFPMYIRPAQSLIFYERFGRKGVVVHTQQELLAFLQVAEREGVEVLLQEVIPGPTTAGYIFQGYFDQRSQPIVIVAAQKLRQPTMFSNQSIHVSIPPTSVTECIQFIVDYFQRIQYRGLFGAEFKKDRRDGEFKLLEVNARSMGGSCFNTACGANDLFAAYRDMLGHTVAPMLSYEANVYYIDEIVELGTVRSLAWQRQLSLRDLLYPYRATKKVFNFFAREDPLPFLTAMTQTLRQRMRQTGFR